MRTNRSITLVGLDCGSTTTSAVVAHALLTVGATGRTEITHVEPIFRSELTFTPFVDNSIDEKELTRLIDQWLSAAGVEAREIFGGGAIVTGLAAERDNALAISRLIEQRLGDSLVATANDPRLESWLAFMGNCHRLSRARPTTPILNVDIGGGTTNLALGLDGEVIATGSLLAGARHFQFRPGTYELVAVSPHGALLLDGLRISADIGQEMRTSDVAAIVDFYAGLIEATIDPDPARFDSEMARRHVQVPLDRSLAAAAVTLSGGVGGLVYDCLRGLAPEGITPFGDLGVELAERLARSETIRRRVAGLAPEGLGRATVLGLLEHGTELSGSTIYLPRPECLPLKSVPIVGHVDSETDQHEVCRLIELAARAAPAGAIRVELAGNDLAQIRALAARLGNCLAARPSTTDRTLVLLAGANVGKVLGNYITRWGTLKTELIVIDEISPRDAQFVRLGRVRDAIVPVSLYAIR